MYGSLFQVKVTSLSVVGLNAKIGARHYVLINNGSRTEWSPIRSVIIRVKNKIGLPRYQLIIKIAISEKKKNQVTGKKGKINLH